MTLRKTSETTARFINFYITVIRYSEPISLRGHLEVGAFSSRLTTADEGRLLFGRFASPGATTGSLRAPSPLGANVSPATLWKDDCKLRGLRPLRYPWVTGSNRSPPPSTTPCL